MKEKLSAAERSIHTLSSEIDEENDTMDGLQEEIDELGKQLEDTRGLNEAGIEAMRKQLGRAWRRRTWSWQSKEEGTPRRSWS